MEYVLVLTVLFSLGAAFLCSLTEAALLAVPIAYAKQLAESGSRAGSILLGFRDDMSRPISAILILSTIANTSGPAIAGAAAESLFGQTGLVVFAVCMTVGVLVFGEIIPKFIGVTYSRPVAQLVAIPISMLITCLSPVVWLLQHITARIEPEENQPSVSHQEVLTMAAIGREEGAIDSLEGSVIENVIGLDQILVRDILTPRVMVFRVPETLTFAQLREEIEHWTFTRIPLHSEDNPDHLTGYVHLRDLYRALLQGDAQKPIVSMKRAISTVPELLRADKLLLNMFERREHICAVVDEHGGLAGVITLEDVIEEVVGREIVDEFDGARLESDERGEY